MTSRELRQAAAQLISEARQIQDVADKEKRALTDEENANFEKAFTDGKAKLDEAKALESGEKRAADLKELEGDLTEPQPIITEPITPGDSEPESRSDGMTREQRAERAYELHLVHGNPENRGGPAHNWPEADLAEYRALQADLDVSGGYTVEPAQFIRRMIQAVDDMTFMRSRATRIPLTTSDKIEGVSLDTDPEDSTWTSEIGDPDEDTAMGFGGRALEPSKLTKLLKVSDKLLEVSGLPIAAIIRERLAYKQAVTQEKVFLTGTGAGQPLGIFTASANGISTSRDVNTDASTTLVKFDHLKSVRGTLKSQYRARAAWVAHRDFETKVAKEKDGEGRYIWQQGVQAGDPDRLLGFPLLLSEFAPNTFTTGLYVAVLGDLSNYWYADIEALAGLDVLREKYYPRIGYVSKSWVDGMPVLEEAFVRAKLA